MTNHFVIDTAPEVWFQADAQPIKTRDQFRAKFGSEDGVYIVYRHTSGDVFSEEALHLLGELHREIDQASLHHSSTADKENALSRIVKIDSLHNVRYQIADGETLISRRLIGSDFPETAAQREERRAIAMGQDSFDRVFFSDDFQYGGIRLKTDFGAISIDDATYDVFESDDFLNEGSFSFDLKSSGSTGSENLSYQDEPNFAPVELDEYVTFMRALRQITNQEKYKDFDFHYVGNAVTMEFTMKSIVEAGWLMALMVVVVIGLLWFLFYSLSAVFWPLILIASAILWSLGLGAWIGITYTSMLVLTFMLVLAVGIACCVHVINAYTLQRRAGHDHRRAIALAYRKTGFPIMLTTCTTMSAMLVLALTDMPIIQIFGLTSGLAVAFAFILSIFVLPLLLDVWHPYKPENASDGKKGFHIKQPINFQPLLTKIAAFTKRYARGIVFSYIGLFALLIYGATQVTIDTNFAELAREGSDIQVTTDLVDEVMMGGLSMEILLDFKHRDALKDPAVLSQIDRWQQHIKQHYSDKVIKTLSLADIVKDTHQVMREGNPAYHTIPGDENLLAQLIYLFDTANTDDRRDIVTDDYSASRITFLLRNAGTYEYTDFFDAIEADIEHFFSHLEGDYPEMDIRITGILHLVMELMDQIAWTQLKSFGLAFLIITAIMMITLGSRQVGLVSIIPNMIPALFTFGLMGLLGIPLNGDTLIVAPVIIGIAVDDTIHFITHYRNAWYEHGDVEVAVRKTVQEVGQAVTFTTLILGIGFSVLVISDYLGLARPGMFGAAAIFVALLSDLLFLPALIQWLKPDLGRKKFMKAQQLAASTAH